MEQTVCSLPGDGAVPTSNPVAYTQSMEHLSAWHEFSRNEKGTHPTVNARVEMKFANGSQVEGYWFRGFFSYDMRALFPITEWRYTEDVTVS
jgi:hypothetical protein